MEMKYMTAETYRDWEKESEPYEENGKMYVKVAHKCPRCGGTGIFAVGVMNGMIIPSPVDEGVCYKCDGTGVERKDVRLYTEKEIAAQQRAKELRMAKKELEEQEKLKERILKAKARQGEWMSKHGFSEDGVTYSIIGEDTFVIKDWLKEQGCKFDGLLKWHSPEPIKIDSEYDVHIIKIDFDEIYTWDTDTIVQKEGAEKVIDKKVKEVQGPSLSEYYGTVGERFHNLTATYQSVRGFSGAFGWTNIYTFKNGENVLVWFTTKELELEKGDVVDLTATVKKHEEFRGVKTTQLSRAIVKEIK